MNSLTLRINRAGGGKPKNSIGFSTVDVSTIFLENTAVHNEYIQKFVKSSTSDDQMVILKKIIDINKNVIDDDINKFLVAVFLQAETKHPMKCFITRYITKSSDYQGPFAEALSKQIMTLIETAPTTFRQYIDLVSKIATCIENFPAGVAGVRMVHVPLTSYLKRCLDCCVKTLRSETPSPTEKNEIFNLAHLSLRLILHIVQKANTEVISELVPMFKGINLLIQEMVFDDDAPMDTKSLCGIVFLSMYVTEHGPHSWVDIFNTKTSCDALNLMLNNAAAELALYSAIATVVSAERLHSQIVGDTPAVIILTEKILGIGERSSSESTFILGVTRTILQISKQLDKTTDSAVGVSLIQYILTFVWAHLEHYMDSVRHLTAQTLACVVRYCARLKIEGNENAIANLFKALSSLDRTRKSYYVSLTCLTSEVGASYVMAMSPDVIVELVAALSSQPIQASATTALETLLQRHAKECDADTIYSSWVQPVLKHVSTSSLESGVLNILENLLARAVNLHEPIIDYIIPFVKQSSEMNGDKPRDLKCILMLLSVARKSSATSKFAAQQSNDEWKGIISYEVLKQAAVDAVDETRILSLSLIVESPKSTEQFAAGDLSLVLWYLKYNINVQAPNFRQLTLSVMKKFMKRLEDSYKVLKRQKRPNGEDNGVDYYIHFVENLRQLCFDSLLQGANYSRRCIALQVLVWCEQLNLEGYNRTWKAEYVEKLLLHLEDSYEANKTFALEILGKCPAEWLKCKKYSISLDIEDIFRQASSLKPTDCVSAAYKLDLLKRKLPEYILQGETFVVVEPVSYALLEKLLRALLEELRVCERSVVAGARQAPMYGLLHCIGHFISCLDPEAISHDAMWSALVDEMVTACIKVNAAVAGVVNNSSPEGHLPMDMSGVALTDHGNSDGLRLDDGRLVTAQMVLLCAWRSVKEVSLLLGAISSRLTIVGEASSGGTLTVEQMLMIGEHFTSLLAETKHRGAFEQAYVGFTKLLGRLWRCRSAALHSLPRSWLDELMQAISSGEKRDKLCATRRSAGLPFMIQALVTTELQVASNPRGFQSCMAALLRAAAEPRASVEARSHALNILRALFRNSALEDGVAGYVGDGLTAALDGFEGGTWAERNSSTLLFSALMVRVFGVQRSRDADKLCVRNRMTGRIFFLRYPQIYDFMLSKLQEVSSNEDVQLLLPSLYPILLLLARLYPSSLEGTVSNLKLVAYIPHVLSCAKSSVLKTRQLAAKAMVPLISPENYFAHLESMFKLLNDSTIKRNYCHGILLQLIKLLEAKPSDLAMEGTESLAERIRGTVWVLAQSLGDRPCYLLADEYVKVLNLIVWSLPNLLDTDTTDKIMSYLDTLIFNTKTPNVNSGRDVCLANCIYLYFVLLNKYANHKTYDIVCKGLQHTSYEVLLSVLNYLLILHKSLDIENKFQEHLQTGQTSVISELRNDRNVKDLLHAASKNTYLECKQKCLKVLTLLNSNNVDKETANDILNQKLIDYKHNEIDNLKHIYLEKLLDFVTAALKESRLDQRTLLSVVRVVLECCSSDNSDNTRHVAVSFMEQNIGLLKLELYELDVSEKFEFQATIWACAITLLEDDEENFRQRISDAVCKMLGSTSRVVPSMCADMIRDHIEGHYDWESRIALLALLALLDFKSVVCMYDDVGEEARVFDQNERYNIFLEETVWTNACADKIISLYNKDDKLEFIVKLISRPLFRSAFETLCGENAVIFQKLVSESCTIRSDALNPKIELFVDRFSS